MKRLMYYLLFYFIRLPTGNVLGHLLVDVIRKRGQELDRFLLA